ncbi:MAG: ATPase, T2SS/T4P/T4SS family [Pseudomonadota bacterium]
MATFEYLDHYAKPLMQYLTDETIIDIAVNPNGKIWVERVGYGSMQIVEGEFRNEDLQRLAKQIAGSKDKTIGKDVLMLSEMLEVDGRPVRVQAVLPPACVGIGALSIRKFPKSQIGSQNIDLLHGRMKPRKDVVKDVLETYANSQTLDAIAHLIIDNMLTVIVSGGTGSGKTTILKALLNHLPHDERIITIEDVPEIILEQENVVPLMSDRKEINRNPKDLLAAVMRMRPDRFLIGELRGDETRTFIEAVNTGHPGSFTTVHANSAELAINRLVLLGMGAASNISEQLMRNEIESTIDLIIHAERIGSERGITEIFSPIL